MEVKRSRRDFYYWSSAVAFVHLVRTPQMEQDKDIFDPNFLPPRKGEVVVVLRPTVDSVVAKGKA